MASLRRKLLFTLLAVTLGLLVCLVLLEIGLRLFWDGFYVKGGPETYSRESHPTRIYANRPGVKFRKGEAEFAMDVTHNSLGFRCPEVGAKDPGRLRILALGDSFTYGVGVDDDETFCARLGQLDPHLEVINAGVNAYGTAQELRLLDEVGLSLQPDLVMVAVFWNDLAGPAVGYSLVDGELRWTRPEPVNHPHPKADRKPKAILRYSYAYRFLSDRIKIAKYKIRVHLGGIEQPDLLTEEQMEGAWTFQLALLGEIARLSREHGAKVLVVIIPDQVQVHPDRAATVTGLDPYMYEIQDRLVAFGRERGIPVLDLLPGLREAAKGLDHELFYEKDRHLVPDGHRIVADLILAELRRLRLVD